MAWDEVSVRTLNAAWKKLCPDCCKIRIAVSSVQDAEDAAGELVAENADIVDKIVSLGKALHLEVNEEDVEELVEEHSKDLTTEDLEELKKQLNQERDKEEKSAHQRRRSAIKREECQQVTLKKCCTTRKSFSLWLQSGIQQS